MNEKGKERLNNELEKFVALRLRPFYFPWDIKEDAYDAKERLERMDSIWDVYKHRKLGGQFTNFPQLTNHEICHEMFWNSFRGRSKMYIQIQDLRFDDYLFTNKSDQIINGNGREDEKEFITLQCSLLTLQMLDYDLMMFRAMGNEDDGEYSDAARKYYRPYFFSYVADINRNDYTKLKELQKKLMGAERNPFEEENGPYLWLACTFNSIIGESFVELDGYVAQSASNIDKIPAKLRIIEDEKTPMETIKSILDAYNLGSSCKKDDDKFVQMIESKLGHNRLSTIEVYRVGNGNCVFAQSEADNGNFFYDIGFNYKHRPKKISHGVTYNYSKTMKTVYTKKPSFFILSHWDMDHIAGSAAAGKDFFEKDWFAPDCFDACTDAKRLAKYLDLKGHLFLARRTPRKGVLPGRLIGQIDIKSNTVPSEVIATYKLYMGKKDKCDGSYTNCEGIAIEYTDKVNEKKVVMMGDVNYASFNKARSTVKTDTKFSDTQIDYLIVPHHGSKHTDYEQITDNVRMVKKGTMAIICCTNETNIDRPNDDHKAELTKRFGKNVLTTEQAKNSVSITIPMS